MTSIDARGMPEAVGSDGAVATTHWLATAAGMAMLARGGNAADAAVTAGFVLQVVEPHLNGPGGEVPILVHVPGDPEPQVINGQGRVPMAASVESFRALGLDLVPGTGLLAACVPGAFGAWMRLLADHGTMMPRDVMTPAIEHAAAGHPLLPTASAAIARVEELFRDEWPESARLWLQDGVPAPGARVRNQVLANTWDRLLRDAESAARSRQAQIEAMVDAFYEGWVAEAIVEHATTPAMDSSGQRHRGLITHEDMAAGRATREPAASWGAGHLRVWKTAAWGQGPVLLQQLALLEDLDLEGAGLNSVASIHAVVECAKLAFADREAWYGEARGDPVRAADLLDPAYTTARRRLVSARASEELRPGHVDGVTPRLPARVVVSTDGAAGIGEPSVARDGVTRGDTVHLDVADRDGMVISATPSGGWLQSSPAIAALGFCLGTRAQMTWLEEGLASSLAGGRRPRTTLSPGIVTMDGEPVLAWGTPGGDQQDQWSLLVLLAHTRFGLGVQAAIDAPRYHIEHMPSSFYPREAHPGRVVVEETIDEATIAGLRARGHEVVVAPARSLGRVTAVARRGGGVFVAGADTRGHQAKAAAR